MLTVREIEEKDIRPLSDYWFNASDDFLVGMGVDLKKMPLRADWENMLVEQISQGYTEKKSYCMIWEEDGKAIGHSNVNKIVFGKEAYMHLHLWTGGKRRKGTGTELVKRTLPYFFRNLKLEKVYSEPYALNPAPNKALPKAGFTFVKKYVTVPGWINFEQEVNLWEISRDKAMAQ